VAGTPSRRDSASRCSTNGFGIHSIWGFFVGFWAAPEMTAGHLLLAVGVSIYMLIAIRYEERDLVGLFGKDYEDYRARVGMLTPRFRRRQP
jgi:protein-S-isoprenylcysteine O-methyltransferase Ste14